MKLEQAIYGSSRGGHAMVAASGFREVAQQLTSRLDLPDTAPTGVTWSPFVTGFPFGEWYVVARTIADEQATRAGMVFSHALLAPIDQIAEFANLRQICSHLLVAPVSTRLSSRSRRAVA